MGHASIAPEVRNYLFIWAGTSRGLQPSQDGAIASDWALHLVAPHFDTVVDPEPRREAIRLLGFPAPNVASATP